ncbi:uncharacterized protein LOC121431434 [Lytechinus variegatus]|uniref:uncharacterized protein LOC121431434 n=1 Tax=Lytechinus variegatus TaxID=7654 RepID=UPI001BB209DA|nr:uncharacterized protein LOC121431434 [Lytechinus variegatus]
MPPVPPQQMDKGNIALYAGAGGGGAFVVILIILIVVAVIYKKRRNEKVNRICSSYGQPLPTIGSGSRVSKSRDNGVDVRDVNDEKEHQCGQPVPGGITYEEISYADGKPDFDETTGDVAALHVYNMPDISPGTPSGPERYTAPNGRDLYTLPDKEQGNQNATQNGDSRHYDTSIDNLYAMPDKSRGATDLDPTLMIENDIYGSS